jgi:WD40 repeat protein
LLVLDNVESILQQGDVKCGYLGGYEAYGELFDRICDERHQSCIVLTGREKPNGMAQREGVNLPVRSIQLTGLSILAAHNILIDKGLQSPLLEQKNLIDYVGGNPLSLKLVATTVQNLFGGDIQGFLAQGTGVFSNLQDLLAEQFDRFSPLQQQVMYWLAINREGVTPARLQAEFLPGISLPTLLSALETLHDRSSIETTERGLTQQPVIMEYVTNRFIQQIEREIITGKLDLFSTHLLIEAQTKDYLREAQIQLILQPLIDRLLAHFTQAEIFTPPTPRGCGGALTPSEGWGDALSVAEVRVKISATTQLEQHLRQILSTLHQQGEEIPSYAAGNLLNLFCHLKTNLQGYNFSYLWIRQAYLLDATLHDVDFTGSHITQSVFAETFGGVVGIKFSPDGQYLATSDTKGDIQIWDADTLTKRTNCQGHQHWTWAIDFSPDGQYLASGSDDGTVKLWAVATGECLYTYKGHTFSVNTIEFSPCGQTIASSSQDGSIRLWRVFPGSSNPEIQTLMGHNGRVWSIDFSPDGSTLVSGGEDLTVRLWKVATGECFAVWEAHTGWVRFVAFSPDGRSIATASYDRSIKIWDVTKIPDFSKKSGIFAPTCLYTLIGHQQAVSSIAFSPDGRQLVSSSFDKTIKIWDANNGKCLKTLLGHRSRIWTVAFHPNGRKIASGGDDNHTKIWDLKRGRCINTIVGHTNAILSVKLSPDGNYLASGNEDNTIKIWDVHGSNIEQTLRDHSNRVWSVEFSPDARLLASGSADYTIKLWDWKLGNCLQTLTGHKSWVWKVVFSPCGQILASSSYDQTVKIWDVQTGECLKTLVGHPSPAIYTDFSPDGKLLASCDFSGNIKLWNLQSGECELNLCKHNNSVWSVAFSADGKWLVSASYDETIVLWSVATGEYLKTFTGHQGAVLAAKFGSEDRFSTGEAPPTIVSVGVDRTVKIWDIQTGECLKTLTGHDGLIYTLDIGKLDSSQSIAFTGSLDETIKVWDLETAKCIATWKSLRPYEGMQIDRIRGLTKAQQASLSALGAVRN